jgi:hypothetical protein
MTNAGNFRGEVLVVGRTSHVGIKAYGFMGNDSFWMKYFALFRIESI